MKTFVCIMIFTSFNATAVMRYDKQKFCCKKPQQQNPNMCTYKSFMSTTGCPQGYQPDATSTNPNGQAYLYGGNCPKPNGTVTNC